MRPYPLPVKALSFLRKGKAFWLIFLPVMGAAVRGPLEAAGLFVEAKGPRDSRARGRDMERSSAGISTDIGSRLLDVLVVFVDSLLAVELLAPVVLPLVAKVLLLVEVLLVAVLPLMVELPVVSDLVPVVELPLVVLATGGIVVVVKLRL